MNHTYEICYVIPTYNRCEQVKKTIAQLLDASEKCQLDYFIFLVDNSTNNETNDFFSNFYHPRLKFKKREVSILNGNLSLHTVLTEVDIVSSWYWWMGDDDLVIQDGLNKVRNLLHQEDISYIHATDLTNTLVELDTKDQFSNLLINFGILNVTSFMSSQIFRHEILLKICDKINNTKSDWDFNFNQSLFLSRVLWNEIGIIVSSGVVIAQSKVYPSEDTQNSNAQKFYDSIKGWFNLYDNLKKLEEEIEIKYPIKEQFFYFQDKPIWYSFFQWIIQYCRVSKNSITDYDYEIISKLFTLSISQTNSQQKLLLIIKLTSQLVESGMGEWDQKTLDLIKLM